MPIGSILIAFLKRCRFPITRVTTGFFLILAGFLVAGVGMTVYPWLDSTIDQMEKWYVEHEIGEFNDALDSFHRHSGAMLHNHARSPFLIQGIKQPENLGEQLATFMPGLSMLGKRSQIVLLDTDGEVLNRTLQTPSFAYRRMDWFRQLLDGSAVRHLDISHQGDNWYWRHAEPVIENDRPIGVLVAELPITIIEEDLSIAHQLKESSIELIYRDQLLTSFGPAIDGPTIDFPSSFPDLTLRHRWLRPELKLTRSFLPLKISLVLVGITLILLLAALLFVRRYFVHPLEQFRDLAHSLAADCGVAQVPVEQPLNELVLLAEDFNTMATQIDLREQALKDARDNLEVMVRALKGARDNLEIKVQERTEELRASQAALKTANETLEEKVEERGHQLAEVQSQMVMQEKMASIGQLAAGIAHELNNPIHFVSANFDMLQECVDDFRMILQEYRSFISGLEFSDASHRALKALKEKEENLQLAAALDDLDQLFEESREGFQRISWIIKSMRDFSRSSQSGEFSSLDLNKGIADSLMLAKNEYKYHADVITEYGAIPHISCIPQQINQVILNLIVNAAQSIASQQGQQRGEIRIRTWNDGEHVCCSVSDNGPGIPEEHRNRIFEPFFTTKEAGKGTGLGLSISYDIVVHKHGGRLSVDCPDGGGPVFTIRLPHHPD